MELEVLRGLTPQQLDWNSIIFYVCCLPGLFLGTGSLLLLRSMFSPEADSAVEAAAANRKVGKAEISNTSSIDHVKSEIEFPNSPGNPSSLEDAYEVVKRVRNEVRQVHEERRQK